jgi:phage gpG-like protein
MRQVGQGVELQTRMRIYHEKTDPEGNRWRPWSANYAKTRKPQHSLLIDTHDMVDSIDSKSTDQTATIFSDVFYAGYNQATRPFLGVSQQNASDIEQFLAPVLEELFVEAMA